MNLTETNFSAMKAALGAISGGPGSARLGEAMAAGWGFPSYTALRDHISLVETCRRTPVHPDAHPAVMIEALTRFGRDLWTARDIAATFTQINGGDLIWEDIHAFPELSGARIIRMDTISETWHEACLRAFTAMSGAWGAEYFRLTLPPGWIAATEFDDIEAHLWIHVPGGAPGGRRLDASDTEILEKLRAKFTLDVSIFFESVLLRIKQHFPGQDVGASDWVHFLQMDKDGLRVECRCPSQDRGMPLWFAVFHDGPIARLEPHPASR